MVAEMITRFSLVKRNLHLRNDRQILGSLATGDEMVP